MAEVVEVDTRVSSDGKVLDLLLFHASSAGRSKCEEVLFRAGADFTTYPPSADPPPIPGDAVVEEGKVSFQVGPLFVVGALETPADDLKAVNRAALYVLREPYDPENATQRRALAATLSLTFPERKEET